MVGANLKSETMKLMDKRSAMEAEMNAIIEQLCQPGGPGLSGNLVDSKGFPRADIDIPVVRAQRHRLAELKNDHQEITEKIDVNIQVLHSAKLTSTPKDSGVETNQNASVAGASASLQNLVLRDSSSANDVDMISSMPFAMVDEIADASPAAEDGLQLGDQIVKFGNVKAGDSLLQRLASEAQANQGHPVPVIIMRQGALLNLSLTPRTWQGRGLLGLILHYSVCCEVRKATAAVILSLACTTQIYVKMNEAWLEGGWLSMKADAEHEILSFGEIGLVNTHLPSSAKIGFRQRLILCKHTYCGNGGANTIPGDSKLFFFPTGNVLSKFLKLIFVLKTLNHVSAINCLAEA
ncbi:hypothetical protein PVK06_014001 [Gossypium arboreum]|uniref:Nas2 N-terminal domain-containing protein n=1 Tax=Gossypium arboreum TaxID=29729 RepID=A0ABR0PTU3_GOSAR|nr:hypothetical protein PVK06_014001 [Gossypium arboreum]